MHEVVERLERLLTLFVLLVLGIALTRGLLDDLDWRGVAIGVALVVLVVRPLAGCVALSPWAVAATRPAARPAAEVGGRVLRRPRRRLDLLPRVRRRARPSELGADWLWSTVAFTIVLSVFVHGVLATPVMKRIGAEPAAERPG